MKIALVHDYIKEYGGAERVLEALHELYPDAPVYTSVYLPKFLGPHAERFKNWDIRTSWAQNLPFKEKLISPLRLLSPFIFRSFDFSEYDVVIVSASGAYFPNSIRCHPELVSGSTTTTKEMPKQVRHDKGAVHITYCHTPPRYLYGYETAREWRKDPIMNVIGTVANHILRMVDFKTAQNVDFFIANSKEVAGRIKKFYRRDSTVIYPPVDVNSKLETRNSKLRENGYFLAGGRLARPKHIDLIVRACAQGKIPLKVFGRGFAGVDEEMLKHIRSSVREPVRRLVQHDKIEFVGEVTDEEKYELMKNAKAYIFAATDEDFGITPVEAMSCGVPVIAYRGGGVLETVVDPSASSGQGTGVFFDELTEESLLKAIKRFDDSNHRSMRQACIKQAEKFSKERFKTEIQMFVQNHMR